MSCAIDGRWGVLAMLNTNSLKYKRNVVYILILLEIITSVIIQQPDLIYKRFFMGVEALITIVMLYTVFALLRESKDHMQAVRHLQHIIMQGKTQHIAIHLRDKKIAVYNSACNYIVLQSGCKLQHLLNLFPEEEVQKILGVIKRGSLCSVPYGVVKIKDVDGNKHIVDYYMQIVEDSLLLYLNDNTVYHQHIGQLAQLLDRYTKLSYLGAQLHETSKTMLWAQHGTNIIYISNPLIELLYRLHTEQNLTQDNFVQKKLQEWQAMVKGKKWFKVLDDKKREIILEIKHEKKGRHSDVDTYYVQDVTQREQDRQTAMQQIEMIETILELTGDGIVILTRQLQVYKCNKAFRESVKLTDQELSKELNFSVILDRMSALGITHVNTNYVEYKKEVLNTLRELRAKRVEIVHLQNNVMHSWYMQPVGEEYVIFVIRNITRHTLSKKIYQSQKEAMRNVLDILDKKVIIFTRGGVITFHNFPEDYGKIDSLDDIKSLFDNDSAFSQYKMRLATLHENDNNTFEKRALLKGGVMRITTKALSRGAAVAIFSRD